MSQNRTACDVNWIFAHSVIRFKSPPKKAVWIFVARPSQFLISIIFRQHTL